MSATLAEVERELTRVVDRLGSMPLARAAEARSPVRAAAENLVRLTRDLGGEVPEDAVLPDLAPHALYALVAVVGRDYLSAARAAPDADVGPALDLLTSLRRALP